MAAAEPAPPDVEPSKPVTLTLTGFAQLDWVVHRQSSQDELDPATLEPLNQDRILLRRGRLRLASRHRGIGGRLELEASTVHAPTVRPFEAVLSYTFPEDAEDTSPHERYTATEPKMPSEWSVTGSLGLMQIPFGFDAVEVTTRRLFLERTRTTQAFFGAARDFGAGISARYRFLRFSAAVMNGEPLTDDAYAGRDLTHAKDVVGRAGVNLPVVPGVSVDAGISFLSGTGLHRGTPATKDSLTWVDGNENGQIEVSELVSIPGTPATASSTYSRGAVGGDARVTVRIPILGDCVVRGELVWAKNLDRAVRPADPVAAGRDLRELGWHFGVTQELTPAAEIGTRYEVYDPDADDRRSQGGEVVPRDASFRTWAFTVAGRLPPARLVVEYDHNDNSLGRAPNGAPTRLRDDVFTLRGEIVF